uniref:Carbonic anhydrase n=1 Tax=Acrobeloides nanus TaxID=290746 RepID=A0A914C7F7_9BILA
MAENDGHRAVFTPINCSPTPYITGGNLPYRYDLVSFHFHHLSEHTVNGNHYPLEVHFVLTRHGKPLSTTITDTTSTQAAAIAVFFKRGSEPTPIDPLVQAMQTILPASGNTATVKSYDISSLLPKNKSLYYRYKGSLGEGPPCNEAFLWTVMKQTKPVTQSQIDLFTQLNKNVDNGYPFNNRQFSQRMNMP